MSSQWWVLKLANSWKSQNQNFSAVVFFIQALCFSGHTIHNCTGFTVCECFLQYVKIIPNKGHWEFSDSGHFKLTWQGQSTIPEEINYPMYRMFASILPSLWKRKWKTSPLWKVARFNRAMVFIRNNSGVHRVITIGPTLKVPFFAQGVQFNSLENSIFPTSIYNEESYDFECWVREKMSMRWRTVTNVRPDLCCHVMSRDCHFGLNLCQCHPH